ncbi:MULTISPECIES: spore cortex biosynthesis protein YabQ [Clostridium]|jgi:spore cortex biosynthesis protein YabQ|uniref:Spore cortex biosynthesis protein YabQ n=1 Tax=Clostridium tertium TaxID=1559 RepID=A0A9X4AZ57_9CLOT|nr:MULTISPECIES: spore cortex biosynthesis protein YabQ [Clostridium]EEH99481.1 spore cortex biosynthesis protein YabQ [Clostridium sp. 7_2_43FAA]MBP1867935.1 spore cortex biosynthesis protein YabQ [Clostridium tertium]MBS5884386.1 spore cortex biosynthesis protein YabQ [Clostridium sp.]MBS6503209.1 spore cortex biosynthesis protein YabQ [Clostridium sp.]MBU6136338.1 spore cortex biosynthesis protein YabQ [Clostridium tertium]
MPLSIDVQFDIVMYSIISGILIGIMFDLYNIIRGVKIPKIIIIIEDILFWILTAIIVFAFLLYANYAFLGPYVYIFMIVTLIIYLKLISPTILKLERYMIDKTGKFIRIFLKNLIYPIKLIYYNICGKK